MRAHAQVFRGFKQGLTRSASTPLVVVPLFFVTPHTLLRSLPQDGGFGEPLVGSICLIIWSCMFALMFRAYIFVIMWQSIKYI